ncbi:hypothetical protein PTTG_01309 [Puccinia triticina 1-1 BBBD Race 1]|uniref:TNFR-Cys domain-containing protein n=2 Tax=Puccinia triticina TaxID=208348 RepID=A0A0C4EKN3_PUCT1|nr:uncharacterized protein PtA15_12A91 [Puccinia triticina]OAV97521.1 hypothetical protein PTTG_01309 [Puccinia triticina 1-1 BBBD Race 1]WAQ90106.1 hypothetical protein PtA15_12A91 [Puccinia triticina]WAR61393.1 hypothetical protein PtB15_12B78 [Puccinia triticina]
MLYLTRLIGLTVLAGLLLDGASTTNDVTHAPGCVSTNLSWQAREEECFEAGCNLPYRGSGNLVCNSCDGKGEAIQLSACPSANCRQVPVLCTLRKGHQARCPRPDMLLAYTDRTCSTCHQAIKRGYQVWICRNCQYIPPKYRLPRWYCGHCWTPPPSMTEDYKSYRALLVANVRQSQNDVHLPPPKSESHS